MLGEGKSLRGAGQDLNRERGETILKILKGGRGKLLGGKGGKGLMQKRRSSQAGERFWGGNGGRGSKQAKGRTGGEKALGLEKENASGGKDLNREKRETGEEKEEALKEGKGLKGNGGRGSQQAKGRTGGDLGEKLKGSQQGQAAANARRT